MISKQEIFNEVSTHLLAQNKQSRIGSSNDMACVYRGPNNLKCAIGCLISDQDYSPSMERKGIGQLIKDFSCMEKYEPIAAFLFDLQMIHDRYEPEYWLNMLNEFADKWNLNHVQKTL